MATSAKVASLFPTLIFVGRLPDAAALNAQLREVIADRQMAEPGVEMSNVRGWQSDVRMLDWGGEAARMLADVVMAHCDRHTVDIKAQGKPRHRWVAEMWANVSTHGASNQSHSHPGAYWSAVYYVDDGYAGSDDRKLAGELVFIDPRMPMVRIGAPDLRYRRSDGSTDHHETWIRPEAGRLVLFPSWLSHSVRPYMGAGSRVSIAVNVGERPISAPERQR